MLKKDEYLKTVRRPYPPLFCSLVCMGYSDAKQFEGILKDSFSITNMAHVDSVWYYGKAELEKGGKLALDSWKDEKRFTHIKQEFKRRADNLVAASQKSFEVFAEAYQEYMPALSLIFAIDKPTETALRNILSKKISPQAVDDIMTKLNVPMEDNFHKQEEYDLVTSSDLKEHVQKYRWLYARYGEENEYILEDAQKKLQSIDKEQFLLKRKEEKEELSKIIVQTKELLGEKAYLVDIFQYMIYYRTHRTDIMNKSAFLAIPMLKEKAKSLGVTYEQLLRCSAEEVLEDKVPAQEVLNNRIKDCSTLLENKKVRCLTGIESQKIIELFKEEVEAVSEFKGNIACKGNVKGTVKLIFGKNDHTKINDGDVLVTSMTTPEMVPVMKKAAAFVTDEGGVTCHAAIISREMNKPCIISAKIATKILKDGDTVEVDANLGIVKILEKK